MSFDHNAAHVGAEVITSDGIKLGIVAEAVDGGVRVDVGMAPDYSLPVRHVAYADDRALRLDFPLSELATRLIPEPPEGAPPRPIGRAA